MKKIVKAFQMAVDLHKSHKLKTPVDIKKLAREYMDVGYFEMEKPVASCLAMGSEKRTSVVINSVLHLNQQRFALAHSLGHHLLHHSEGMDHVDRMRHRTSAHDLAPEKLDMDIEANEFAFELLMPARDILHDVGWIRANIDDYDDDDVLRRLSLSYGVSQMAIALRLNDLKAVNWYKMA